MPVRSGENELSIDAVPVGPIAATGYRANARGAEFEARVSSQGLTIPRAFALAAIGFALVLASNLVSLGFDQLRTTLINANWEFSWSHDADTILLGIGVCTSLIGARHIQTDRRRWLAIAGILALFFLDEVSALHGQLRNFDKLLYAPILVGLVIGVWRLTAGKRERTLVVFGLTTLLLAFAMHVAGLHLLRPLGYTNYVYQAGVGFKEGTELAGLILVVAALWRRASRAP